MTAKVRNMIKAEKAPRKMTKKQVYAKYGIVYKDEKILSPIGFIRELLKAGNDKTGNLVLTFSVLPGTGYYTVDVNGKDFTVKGTCVCDCIGCYAKTGHYNHAGTIRSMVINTFLVNYHIDFVKRCIMAQLDYMESGEIRIHAAGDFNTINSDEYAAMWHDVAEKYDTFIFWTYTKIKKYETLFDDLKNANIVKSIIPGIGFNYGHCDHIINAYYTLRNMGKRVYICRCGIDKDQHCQGCQVCGTYEYVLFIEHSTDYKAEADPLYEKLCMIINNQ